VHHFSLFLGTGPRCRSRTRPRRRRTPPRAGRRGRRWSRSCRRSRGYGWCGRRRWPGLGTISSAGIEILFIPISSTPDDHFTIRFVPDRCVKVSGIGRVSDACSRPTVCEWIKSAAGVQNALSAPHDHFTACPHCRVSGSSRGRVNSGSIYPTVGAGIVSTASIKNADTVSAPDDHFAAGPHCRVKESPNRRVRDFRS
jgi:hypothetical protein